MLTAYLGTALLWCRRLRSACDVAQGLQLPSSSCKPASAPTENGGLLTESCISNVQTACRIPQLTASRRSTHDKQG
ncbi:hypothetical protein GE09DRAFT_1099505, partial [Coniochaeta sp. 2T2.1]